MELERQRDLLPLPFLDSEEVASGGLSRSVRQRVDRRRWVAQRSNEVIWGLNALCGLEEVQPKGAAGSAVSLQAVSAVQDAVRSLRVPQSRPSPQEALQALLHESARYGGPSGSVAPFGTGEVSLPSVGTRAKAVSVYELLPPGDADRLRRRCT